jgi:predicted aspartyl protease
MPILSRQFVARQDLGGVQAPIHPAIVLQKRGPTVQVTIAPLDELAAQLVKKNLPVPQPVTGEALIDTGASMTCIDDQAAKALSLPVINVVEISSASHASHPASIYPAKIEIVGFPMRFNLPMVMGAPLQPQGLIALIGRDILMGCQLVYNGTTGSITLAF